MNPTLVKDRTHCPKGHDLRIHGYYFGANQRCRICNRRRVKAGHSAAKNHVSEKGASDVPRAGRSPVGMQDKFTQSEDEFGVAHISGVMNRRLQILLSELLQKNHELLSKWLASTARTKPVAPLAFNLNK